MIKSLQNIINETSSVQDLEKIYQDKVDKRVALLTNLTKITNQYEEAAEAGDADAMYECFKANLLVELYNNDYKLYSNEDAIGWLKKAADKGHKQALINYIIILVTGAYGGRYEVDILANYNLALTYCGYFTKEALQDPVVQEFIQNIKELCEKGKKMEEPMEQLAEETMEQSTEEPVTELVEQSMEECIEQQEKISETSGNDQSVEILELITSLHEKFDRKISVDEHKNELFNNMHEELVALRNDKEGERIKAICMEIIQIIDTMYKNEKIYGQAECSEEMYMKLLKVYVAIRHQLEDILYQQSIEPYETDGDEVNVRRQKIVATVPTDDEELNNRIAERVASGYEKEDKVIRPERIKVYKYNK